jgi:hypothetical protein
MSKYQGDGHNERIDPARLVLGSVLRMPYGSGSIPAFGDSVVTGIYVSYARTTSFGNNREHFSTLAEAMAKASKDDFVFVKLARPYTYCNNPFDTIPGWLVGVESYEAMGNRLIDTHRVVVQSTGEYATMRA